MHLIGNPILTDSWILFSTWHPQCLVHRGSSEKVAGMEKDFRPHWWQDWSLGFKHSHPGLPESAFSALSLLSRSEKAPERGYLFLLLEARLNLFGLTVPISCWKLLYPSLGAEADVILSIVAQISALTPLAASVVLSLVSPCTDLSQLTPGCFKGSILTSIQTQFILSKDSKLFLC